MKAGKFISKLTGNPYILVNGIFAGIILFIFIYSGIFSASKDNHPVPSFFEEITGEPSPSSGMSRAFSEILRGDLDSARSYNPDSVLIFIFFLVQLVQRGLVSFLVFRPGWIQKKHLLYADVFFSVIFFLFCFRGQLRAMIYLIFS